MLITDYQFELVEDHHNPGSGRYGVRISIPIDISASFPYLNAILDDSIYDHENGILIGASSGQRYAFRPHEIQCGMVMDVPSAKKVAEGLSTIPAPASAPAPAPAAAATSPAPAPAPAATPAAPAPAPATDATVTPAPAA